MIPLLSAEEMRSLETAAIQGWGIPSRVLQEHAALGALALVPPGVPLHVLAGPGNNGGDALALARLARLQGRAVEVWALPGGTGWKGDAAAQAQLWEGLGGTIRTPGDPASAVAGFHGWVVDGLFGLGTRLPLEGAALAWVEALLAARQAGSPFRVLALDLPTGLDPGSGEVPGPVLRADATACFGYRKVCHGLRPALDACGTIHLVPIPLHQAPVPSLALQEAPGVRILQGWDTHKRDFGHVALRAGRVGMSGAAVLAALGALHGGAGLVTVLVDPEIRAEVAMQVPEAMVQAWRGTVPDGVDVLVAGPGGVEDVPAWKGPLVLDASALGPGAGPLWMERPETVLTPHPGEFRRLFGVEDRLVGPGGRLAALREVVQGPGVLVLKGAQTLVGGGSDPLVLACPTGHPGLSTGGAGDFLAGLVAARVAQWVRAGRPDGGSGLKRAASEAVWLHGTAADRLGPGPLRVTELGLALAGWMRERMHDGSGAGG